MASKKKCADGGMAGGKMAGKKGSMPPWMQNKAPAKKGKKKY